MFKISMTCVSEPSNVESGSGFKGSVDHHATLSITDGSVGHGGYAGGISSTFPYRLYCLKLILSVAATINRCHSLGPWPLKDL